MIIMLIITGCSIKNENEEIKYFIMSYNSNVENKDEDDNILYVFFDKDEVVIEYKNYLEGIKHQYIVNDVETLNNYINSIKSKSDKSNKRVFSEDMQAFLWSIYFETEDKGYSYAGFDDYPDYWEELWQVLLEVSEAESLEDFGF